MRMVGEEKKGKWKRRFMRNISYLTLFEIVKYILVKKFSLLGDVAKNT